MDNCGLCLDPAAFDEPTGYVYPGWSKGLTVAFGESEPTVAVNGLPPVVSVGVVAVGVGSL